MAKLGTVNTLSVLKQLDFGAYLDGGELGEILLPIRYVPVPCQDGDELEVFLYRDSEDRLIATTERPKASVGEFALLEVTAVNRMGAFLDWGLPKELLVPFGEQRPRMQQGKSYIVRIFIDEATDRIVGSSRLEDFLYDRSEGELSAGDRVSMLITGKTDLGYRAIVDDTYWGLLHENEVVKPLKRGEKIDGFIRRIREDGRIDLCLHLKAHGKQHDAADILLTALQQAGGTLDLGDRSDPELIQQQLGISKKAFKMAIGKLYKQRLISIAPEQIQLQQP